MRAPLWGRAAFPQSTAGFQRGVASVRGLRMARPRLLSPLLLRLQRTQNARRHQWGNRREGWARAGQSRKEVSDQQYGCPRWAPPSTQGRKEGPKGFRRVPREPLRQEVCTTKWPGGSGWNWVVHGQERMEFPGLEPRCSTHRNVFLWSKQMLRESHLCPPGTHPHTPRKVTSATMCLLFPPLEPVQRPSLTKQSVHYAPGATSGLGTQPWVGQRKARPRGADVRWWNVNRRSCVQRQVVTWAKGAQGGARGWGDGVRVRGWRALPVRRVRRGPGLVPPTSGPHRAGHGLPSDNTCWLSIQRDGAPSPRTSVREEWTRWVEG